MISHLTKFFRDITPTHHCYRFLGDHEDDSGGVYKKNIMLIKSITIEKSKTLELSGLGVRDSFRKIRIAMTADVEENEDHNVALMELSIIVDQALEQETLQLKNEFKNRRAKSLDDLIK